MFQLSLSLSLALLTLAKGTALCGWTISSAMAQSLHLRSAPSVGGAYTTVTMAKMLASLVPMVRNSDCLCHVPYMWEAGAQFKQINGLEM